MTSAVEAECQGARIHGDDMGSCLISHGDNVPEPGLYSQPHRAPGTVTQATRDHLFSHLAFRFPEYRF